MVSGVGGGGTPGQTGGCGAARGDGGQTPALTTPWATREADQGSWGVSLSVSFPVVPGTFRFPVFFTRAPLLPHFLVSHNFTLFLKKRSGTRLIWGSEHFGHPSLQLSLSSWLP